MKPSARTAANQWMRDNGGLLTTAHAEALGIDRRALSRAAATGELERARQRVYLLAGLDPDWNTELAADLAACHADAWASQTAALKLHDLGLRALPAERELVVLGSARPTVASDVVIHRTGTLDPVDQTVVDGLTSTTVERAMVDVAGRLTVVQRLLLLDEAIMSEAADRQRMFERAEALWRGRKGVRTLSMATAPGAEDRFRSRLEKLGAPLLIAAGLTDLQFNVVPSRAPAAGLTDVVCETDGIIVDWDGLRFHAGPRARQRDNEKSNAAVLGGYIPLRFTWYDVKQRGGYVTGTTRRARLASSRRAS